MQNKRLRWINLCIDLQINYNVQLVDISLNAAYDYEGLTNVYAVNSINYLFSSSVYQEA
jgi:hypothetical protein